MYKIQQFDNDREVKTIDNSIFIAVGTGAASLLAGYMIRKKIAESKITSAEDEAKRIIDESRRTGETLKKEVLIEGKEEIQKMRSSAEAENKERRNELQSLEKRLINKESILDRKAENIERKDEGLSKKVRKIDNRENEIEKLYHEQKEELERVAGLTGDQAKQILLDDLEKEIVHESAKIIKDNEAKTKMESEKKARNIITYAIQKCSTDHVAESTVSVVALPSDEMKGRIIGREGRNIRTLETLTGVDLIIDDTPEAVILSSFDPVRREIARSALEKLIADGRIHPARIEEMVNKAKKELEAQLLEFGEQATFDANIHGVHPELIKLLGRLNFRTSYGQNVLKHSIEVAYLAGTMAAEIGADVRIAKRAGLLHDIGKAVDHEIEGTHIEIGIDLCKKYKENAKVLHAIAAHHGDIEPQTIEAILVQAADAISAARPGARRETLETYIKRLEKLEEISNSFDGVDKSFAIQAGREIRIMVNSDLVNDDQIIHMSRDIVKRIEGELEYPGQIKVNVIRETRAIEYAK
jgi:ribonuclease Y